jgi:hypothetical protein
MIATVLVGATMLGGQRRLQPVQTASPYPTTASPTPPRRTAATPTPSVTKASMNLDVRPMSKAEIAADTRSCLRPTSPDDNIPRRGAIRVLYAVVQIQAGVSGPVSHQARTLVLQDEAGTWFCENGKDPSWTAGSSLTSGGRRDTQVAAYGGFGMTCRDTPKVSTEVLFAVGEEVVLGRTRISLSSTKGPWQTSRPDRGMVNFRLVLEGNATRTKPAFMEFEMLDRRGDRVTIRRNAKAGGPDAGKTAKMDIYNCADNDRLRARRKPVTRPATDAAGITTCLEMVKESATNSEVPFSNKRKPRLVISSKQRWGAVLRTAPNSLAAVSFPPRRSARSHPTPARSPGRRFSLR